MAYIREIYIYFRKSLRGLELLSFIVKLWWAQLGSKHRFDIGVFGVQVTSRYSPLLRQAQDRRVTLQRPLSLFHAQNSRMKFLLT